MSDAPEPATAAPPCVRFRDVTRVYGGAGQEVRAVRDLTLDVPTGSFLAVMGPSGSGKSTLLHLAGAIDVPTSGTVEVEGRSTDAMDEDERARLRRTRVGFVFQFFHLLPTLTIEENIALPRLIAGERLRDVRPRLDPLLERVRLAHRRDHRPGQLSGGEMQRAALARALVIEPTLLLADEPTGNLDSANGREVLGLLRTLVDEGEGRRTIMMVTHDAQAAGIADRILHMRDGRLDEGA
ncbi:MAG: ABC transporter ATP-binding protein [Planctomycetota bacterium]